MDELLALLVKAGGIFALAFFSFWPAIPAGLALGLSPALVIATTTLSYASGVALVTLFGERIRRWITRRMGSRATDSSMNSPLRRIWARFGPAGLGLAAPMTVGAQIGAALGLALNIGPRRLFLWMVLGALLWSIALTVLVLLGLLGARAMTGG